MLTITLSALFFGIAILTGLSLADSAMRWRSAWHSLRHEMTGGTAQDAVDQHADVIAFHNVHPFHHPATRGIQADFNRPFDVAA